MADVSVVVLTMGDRPIELEAAIASARRQSGVEIEVVLVVNGGEPDRTLADLVVDPDENLGIPKGRNVGAAASSCDLICFLDDDGELHPGVLDSARAAFRDEARLAVIGLRVIDPEGNTARRHLPGLRKDPEASRESSSFPGGACVVRRAAFDEVGGLCGAFHYGLEETDLAWRLIDADWTVQYRADLKMNHPRTSPTRHPSFFLSTARNRVWLAHRSLPFALALIYLSIWTMIAAARSRLQPSAMAAHIRGMAAGLRRPIGPRSPLRWSTIKRMTAIGRPPII